MKKHNESNAKLHDQRAYVLKELRAAGLQVASTSQKLSEIPYYSSVSGKNKKILIVK